LAAIYRWEDLAFFDPAKDRVQVRKALGQHPIKSDLEHFLLHP
jgi:hypothetical protein